MMKVNHPHCFLCSRLTAGDLGYVTGLRRQSSLRRVEASSGEDEDGLAVEGFEPQMESEGTVCLVLLWHSVLFRVHKTVIIMTAASVDWWETGCVFVCLPVGLCLCVPVCVPTCFVNSLYICLSCTTCLQVLFCVCKDVLMVCVVTLFMDV